MNDNAKRIASRIRNVRGFLSQREFASHLNVAREYISQIERGLAHPGRKLLQAISDAFNINISWLLYGEGPKERQGQVEAEAVHEKAASPEEIAIAICKIMPKMYENFPPPAAGNIDIPVVRTPVSAGFPDTLEDDAGELIPLHKSLLPSGTAKHRLAGLDIKGNSMTPTLPEGARCILDLSQNEPALLSGQLVVAKIDNECLIKRLVRNRRGFSLSSDNPEYAPIPVGPDVQILGRVILVFWSPD